MRTLTNLVVISIYPSNQTLDTFAEDVETWANTMVNQLNREKVFYCANYDTGGQHISLLMQEQDFTEWKEYLEDYGSLVVEPLEYIENRDDFMVFGDSNYTIKFRKLPANQFVQID